MLWMLGNVCMIIVVGFGILLVRRLFAKKLYPQVLTAFWMMFFICSLVPFGLLGEIRGKAAERSIVPDGEIAYERGVDHWELLQENAGNIGIVELVHGAEMLGRGVLVIWGIGVIVLSVGHYKAAKALKKELAEHSQEEFPKEKLKEWNMETGVEVYVTDGIGPMVHGVKSVIYIPRSLLGESECKNALLHEVTHVQRKHPWLLLLIQVVGILYWLLPFVEKVFLAALREDMEYACDYYVLEKYGVDRKVYAGQCVRIVEKQGQIFPGLSFGKSNLKMRVQFILQEKKSVKLTLLGMGALYMLLGMLAGGHYLMYGQRDVNGFTKAEVWEAKATLIHLFQTVKEGGDIKGFLTEAGPYRNVAQSRDSYEYVLYDIAYEPGTYNYYYIRRYFDQHELEQEKCISFTCDMDVDGKKRSVFFYLVQEEGEWKLYDGGY